MTTQLPDKPSELIRVALADLEKCEADKRYAIYMGRWHEPLNDVVRTGVDGHVCAVCLAGAVMAQSLGTPVEASAEPVALKSHDIVNKLYALDDFRIGDIEDGLSTMCSTIGRGFGDRQITPYEVDAAQFKADMRQLADDLEGAGL